MVIYSYEYLDGDFNVNWPGLPGVPCLNCADLDGDGIINTLDPDMDDDGIPNPIDPDMDGDGQYNFNGD